MSNAGQGTRGMSGSDWTRMKKLNRAKTYNAAPTPTNATTFTASGNSTGVSSGNVLGYTASGTKIIVSSNTTNSITYTVAGTVPASNQTSPVYFASAFANLLTNTPYYFGTVTGGGPYTATLYTAVNSGGTQITNLYPTLGTAYTVTSTVTISSVDSTGVFTYTATTALTNGDPIVFNTAIGGLTPTNVTYYIFNLTGTTFTVSTTEVTNTPPTSYTIPSSTVATNIGAGNSIRNVSIASSGTLGYSGNQVIAGQQITLPADLGNITANTYYVGASPTSTTFSISTSPLGSSPLSSITTGTGTLGASLNVYGITVNAKDGNTMTFSTDQLTTYLAQNKAVIFTSSNITGLTAGKVYFLNGFSTGTGGVTLYSYGTTGVTGLGSTGAASGVVFPTATSSYTFTWSTVNATRLTQASLPASFSVGQPIVFSSTVASYGAGTTLYVQSVTTGTNGYITVSYTPNGSALTLTIGATGYPVPSCTAINPTSITGTGVLTVTATSPAVSAGSAVVFTTSTTGINAGTPYFATGTPTTTSIQLSATYGGANLSGVSVTPGIGFVVATNTIGTAKAKLSAGNTTQLTLSTVTNVAVCQPIVFNTTYDGITAGSLYYINSFISPDITLSSTYPNSTNVALTGTVITSNITTPTLRFTVSNASASGVLTINTVSPMPAQLGIQFNNPFWGLASATTYYLNNAALINTSTSTTITSDGTAVPGTYYSASGSSAVPSDIFTITSNNTSAFTGSITTGSAGSFVPGLPIQFSARVGGVSTSTYYYVSNTPTTSMTITSDLAGSSPVTLTNGANSSVGVVAANIGSFSSSNVFSNPNNNTTLTFSGTVGALGSGFGTTADLNLVFGIQNQSNQNPISFYVDLVAPNIGKISLNIAGNIVSTGATAITGDVLSFRILGTAAVFYQNNNPIYSSSVPSDNYSVYSSLTPGSLIADQSVTVSYSKTLRTSDLQTNNDIQPQMASQVSYNQSLLIKPVVGTSKTRRSASNWTDFIASQTGDFVLVSQNSGLNGTAQPGIVQTDTNICDGSTKIINDNALPNVNAFNRLKILS